MTEKNHSFITLEKNYEWLFTFSICCLVSSLGQYHKVRNAYSAQGFNAENAEFLICDNSQENVHDAFEAVRIFMREARGRYVLIAHQDAYPLEPCSKLVERLNSLEKADPMWGVAGNSGVERGRWLSLHGSLEMPGGIKIEMKCPFERVTNLDENVLLVRNGTGITVSGDLRGYHLYGADLCLVADRLGFSSYVLDYRWHHESYGTIGDDFFFSKKKLVSKLERHYAVTSAPTTCTHLNWRSSAWSKADACARSLLQVALDPRNTVARAHLLKEGLKNPFFLPAVLGLCLRYGPSTIRKKVLRRLGLPRPDNSSI